VLRFRELYKTRTSYLEAMFEAAGGELGGASSTPASSRSRRAPAACHREPAAPAAARRGPDRAPRVIAREDDDVVVSADFGQIELRMWASIFKDDRPMIAALKDADATGDDFFVEVGRQVYGEPGFQKKDPRRRLLKSTVYAKLFGGGIETAAATAGVNVYDLVPTWKALENTYPSLKTLGRT
jgi:DNA polymerase-1